MQPRSKNGSLKKEVEVDFWDFHWGCKPEEKTQKETEKTTSSLKRLETVQASTEKNTIYREALILLKGIMKCQRQA